MRWTFWRALRRALEAPNPNRTEVARLMATYEPNTRLNTRKAALIFKARVLLLTTRPTE